APPPRSSLSLHDALPIFSVVGTAAMIWVGGHILLVGAHELGWDWPYDLVHDAEHEVEGVAGVGGALAWLVNTAISAVIGLAVGRSEEHTSELQSRENLVC